MTSNRLGPRSIPIASKVVDVCDGCRELRERGGRWFCRSSLLWGNSRDMVEDGVRLGTINGFAVPGDVCPVNKEV